MSDKPNNRDSVGREYFPLIMLIECILLFILIMKITSDKNFGSKDSVNKNIHLGILVFLIIALFVTIILYNYEITPFNKKDNLPAVIAKTPPA